MPDDDCSSFSSISEILPEHSSLILEVEFSTMSESSFILSANSLSKVPADSFILSSSAPVFSARELSRPATASSKRESKFSELSFNSCSSDSIFSVQVPVRTFVRASIISEMRCVRSLNFSSIAEVCSFKESLNIFVLSSRLFCVSEILESIIAVICFV